MKIPFSSQVIIVSGLSACTVQGCFLTNGKQLAFFLVPLLALFIIFTPILLSAYLPEFRCYRKHKGGIWYQVCPKYMPGACEYWTQTLPEFAYYINNVEDYAVTETYSQDYRK